MTTPSRRVSAESLADWLCTEPLAKRALQHSITEAELINELFQDLKWLRAELTQCIVNSPPFIFPLDPSH
jgi:hypothetical protein